MRSQRKNLYLNNQKRNAEFIPANMAQRHWRESSSEKVALKEVPILNWSPNQEQGFALSLQRYHPRVSQIWWNKNSRIPTLDFAGKAADVYDFKVKLLHRIKAWSALFRTIQVIDEDQLPKIKVDGKIQTHL